MVKQTGEWLQTNGTVVGCRPAILLKNELTHRSFVRILLHLFSKNTTLEQGVVFVQSY